MQLKLKSILLFVITIFGVSFGQTNQDDIVLAKFAGHNITWGEFSKAYSKDGMAGRDISGDSLSNIKKFLDLYVNYKMKLQYGKDLGLFNSPDILNEVNNYKNQILISTYVERNITEPNLKRLYERRKWEIRLSHILFRPNSNDSAATLKLANAVLDSLRNGADFSVMAARYSMDNTAKNGGDLYYLTAGQIPIDIENVIYDIPVDSVYPKIFKSQFGYHIFKVTEKRKRIPEIRASHILLSFKQDGKIDTAKARAIIDTVYQKLMAGEDFAELAKKYSNDLGSAAKGGDLGYFDRRRMIQPFGEAAFNLKKIGDISKIIPTQFGFHIIKLTGIKEYPTFENDKENLLKLYNNFQQVPASNIIYDSLKQKSNFTINQNTLREIITRIDTSKNGFDINELPQEIKDLTLFSYGGKNVTINDFIEIVKNLSPEENKTVTSMDFETSVNKIGDKLVILDNCEELKKSIPNFDSMLSDYLNGTVIFKLQQDEVWNKLAADSLHLLNFYNKHKNKYNWPDRVQFTEVYAANDSVLNLVKKEIKNKVNFDSLCAKYTQRPGFAQKAGKWELNDINTNELYEAAWKLKKIGEISKPIVYNTGHSIIRLDKKDPARHKTFEEAKPEVIINYQEQKSKELEDEFANKLKKEFNPEIFYDRLEKIKK